MLQLDQSQQQRIDYKRFEKLLFHVSRFLNLSIQINDLNGQSVIRCCNNFCGTNCEEEIRKPGSCHEESLALLKRVEKSGKTEMQKCCDSFYIIGIPISCKCKQDLASILFACSRTGTGMIIPEVKEFLEELAVRISSDIHQQTEINEFTEELTEKYEELSLIYDIGKKLVGMGSAHKAVTYIVKHAVENLNPDMVLASIPGDIIYDINYGNPQNQQENIFNEAQLKKLDKVVIERLSSSEMPASHIVLNNIHLDEDFDLLIDRPMGLLAVPVNLKGSVAGFLSLINFDVNKSFETNDVRLTASLAQQISLVYTNTELYHDLKDFLLNVIKTLVHSIEAKDSYTKGHSERVNRFSMMIADSMNLSPDEMEALNWASMLHDIGKLGVPENILTKPGKLTKEETLQIREHPEKGYRILLPIGQLNESLSGIRHHHERFDGNGYPAGLQGKEIPLYARIIAVADTYDAMTSTRSYRTSMSHEAAVAEIMRVRETQFDPELVDIFLILIEKSITSSALEFQNK